MISKESESAIFQSNFWALDLAPRFSRDYPSGFKVALRRLCPFVLAFAPMTPRCFGGRRPPSPRCFGGRPPPPRSFAQTHYWRKSVVPKWVWTGNPWDRALALGYCPHFSSQLLYFILTPPSQSLDVLVGKACFVRIFSKLSSWKTWIYFQWHWRGLSWTVCKQNVIHT